MPPANVAEYVKMSPASISEKVEAGIWKLKAVSSAAGVSGMGVRSAGASLVLATAKLKVSLTEAPALSVAVTCTEIVPTSLLVGVPVKVRVAALNVSHEGKGVPPANVAEYVKMSPASISEKVEAGIWKLKAVSSAAGVSGIEVTTVGASLVLATVKLKVSLTEAPALSVAVTCTEIVPTSLLVGVPVKVRVAALNVSHEGKGVPPANVAEYVKMSPASISEKVEAGIWKLKAVSSAAGVSGIEVTTVGALLVLATVKLKVSLTEAPALSVAVTCTEIVPTSLLVGVPVKVRVAALNVSHEGKGVPPANVAEYVKMSPASISEKVEAGIWKLKAVSSAAGVSGMGVRSAGASLTFATESVKFWSTVAMPSDTRNTTL